ncbi:MAG TPA: YaiI/YqxD family protein [Erysipelothrix sp.]
MKIYIDGDGSPVVKETIAIAKVYQLEVIVVKNYAHEIVDDYATVVSVDVGFDSADYYIVNKIEAHDLVITQDYGLASLCLTKNALVMNQNGLIFTNDNIETMLSRRYLHAKMRAEKKRHQHIPKRSQEDNDKFKKALMNIIEKHL